MNYIASENRYQAMQYRRCGASGLMLPAISLGLWQNFGYADSFSRSQNILLTAFDQGITYFDLANNYGPPPGSAEEVFGRIFASQLKSYRDEIVIATKAGYTMWDGPYGDWGSRKSMIASCDQSLKRMGLDYVDIFYSHRYDPLTPLEETMGALDYIVRSGRALYAALSNYPADKFNEAVAILKRLGTPCIAHQIKYSMIEYGMGESLFKTQKEHGVGCVSFSPLAQGVLTDKYLNGIPPGSRAARDWSLHEDYIKQHLGKVKELTQIALNREQTLAEMAIAWQLSDERVTSVLIGVSSTKQLLENLNALKNTKFSTEEIAAIDAVIYPPKPEKPKAVRKTAAKTAKPAKAAVKPAKTAKTTKAAPAKPAKAKAKAKPGAKAAKK